MSAPGLPMAYDGERPITPRPSEPEVPRHEPAPARTTGTLGVSALQRVPDPAPTPPPTSRPTLAPGSVALPPSLPPVTLPSLESAPGRDADGAAARPRPERPTVQRSVLAPVPLRPRPAAAVAQQAPPTGSERGARQGTPDGPLSLQAIYHVAADHGFDGVGTATPDLQTGPPPAPAEQSVQLISDAELPSGSPASPLPLDGLPVQTAVAPAPAAAPGPGAGPGTGAAQGHSDLEELARQLYDPLAARLRAELWLDRERSGLVTDLRR